MSEILPEIIESKEFLKKGNRLKKLYFECLKLLSLFGLPLDQTPRRLERTVGAFLALCNIKSVNDLNNPENIDTPRTLKTRDIINWENENLGENISSGSYDDIRRKDLKLLVLGHIVLKSSPNSATNDSTRGYGVNPIFAEIMKSYGSKNWEDIFKARLKDIPLIKDILRRERELDKIPVKVSNNQVIEFSNGEHNILQKKIIEVLLPRFGYHSELLYVGDTSDKYLFVEEEKMKNLNLPKISHNELPAVIAYSQSKNWIYFIEAVHSSGPISEIRLLQLKEITQNVKSDIVFITSFLNVKTFRKFAHDIAWETEVWIADNPDHMIHFNGDKFLGPY